MKNGKIKISYNINDNNKELHILTYSKFFYVIDSVQKVTTSMNLSELCFKVLTLKSKYKKTA